MRDISWFNGKKICFIAGTLGQGGAERQLYYMASTLKEHGADVQVLCLTRGEYWEAPLRELGVPVIWVGETPSRIVRIIRILRQLRCKKPDILQSAHFYTNLYVALAGRLLSIPAVGAMRNDCFSEVADNGKFLGSLQLRLPRFIAGNSLKGIENARSLGIAAERLFFLPNVIDTGRFTVVTPPDTQPLKVLTAGRLTQQKRQDRFIRLIARLQQEAPGLAKGLVAGDGPLRPELQIQALAAGLLPEQLTFLGKVSRMQEVYDSASVFVLTSDWEGTPNVVMEAMACGLPVVVTDAGGVSDLIEQGVTGIIVSRDDESELFVAVRKLLRDTELRERIGANARAAIVGKHSLDLLPEYLAALYQKSSTI